MSPWGWLLGGLVVLGIIECNDGVLLPECADFVKQLGKSPHKKGMVEHRMIVLGLFTTTFKCYVG